MDQAHSCAVFVPPGFSPKKLKDYMGIVIEGLAELSDRLANMAPKSAKRYLSKAGDAGTEVVLDALQETVPVQVGYLEEAMVSQKKWLNDGDATTMVITIGPARGVFWGSLQEFGSQEVEGVGKDGRHFIHAAQPAQHWMTRAFESSKDEVLSAMATEMVGMLQDLENKD